MKLNTGEGKNLKFTEYVHGLKWLWRYRHPKAQPLDLTDKRWGKAYFRRIDVPTALDEYEIELEEKDENNQ